MTLLVQLLKVVLDKLQSIEHRFDFMVFVDILNKFLLVVFRHTLIKYFELCSLFRIFLTINLNIQSILLEIKMHLHLFLKQKWSHLDSEMEEISLYRSKMISKFSYYLVVLFLSWIL